MNILSLLPETLKEIVKHLPVIIFDLIDWKLFQKEVFILGKRLINDNQRIQWQQSQKNFIESKINIGIDDQNSKAINYDQMTGEQVLRLYFLQVYSPYGVFLDLRSSRFSIKLDKLFFHPNNIWTKFNEQFRKGLIDLYEGFYLGEDKLFVRGLVQTGLLDPSWSQQNQDELIQLFRSHFGDGQLEEMTFCLESFQVSFQKILKFLLNHKVKMSIDFIYLGLYLVTLYSTLQDIKLPLNVRRSFLDVYQQCNQNKEGS